MGYRRLEFDRAAAEAERMEIIGKALRGEATTHDYGVAARLTRAISDNLGTPPSVGNLA